jgi:hypothetical protein
MTPQWFSPISNDSGPVPCRCESRCGFLMRVVSSSPSLAALRWIIQNGEHKIGIKKQLEERGIVSEEFSRGRRRRRYERKTIYFNFWHYLCDLNPR